MNNVILMGNLVRDPEVKSFAAGASVCEFTIAVSKRWKTQSGEQKEKTAFIACAMWGARGEAFAKHHRKGQKALIRGELTQESWEDRETGKKRERTKVEATEWEFLTSRSEGSESAPAPARATSPAPSTEDDSPPF